MSKNGHVVTHFDPAKASSNQNRGLKTAPKNSASVRLDGNIARRAVRGSEFFWWDTDLPGFGLRTFPGGAKSWFVQFRQRGKQKRVTLGRPGEMSAIDARTAARSHLANVALDGLPAMPKASRKANATIRFGDYAPRFWEDYSRHWKPSTRKGNHHSIFKELVKEFGHQRVDAIRRADILRWRDSCVERGGAFNRTIPIMSVMMSYAEQLGLRPRGSNPCKGTPRYKRKKMDRFLSAREFARLADSLREHQESHPLAVQAIRLLIYTGARRGEIEGLRWEWIQPPRIMLPDSKTGAKIVYLNSHAQAVIEAIVWLGDEARMLLSTLERRAPSDPVFWNKLTKRPVRDIEAFWRDVKAEAGLPGVRLHDLRHSFASHAAARSETLPMIGKLLGHARLQSTSRYAHLDDGHVLDAAERIGQLIEDALGESRTLNHNTKCDRESPVYDR